MISHKSNRLVLTAVLLFVVVSFISPQVAFSQATPPADPPAAPAAPATPQRDRTEGLEWVAEFFTASIYDSSDDPTAAQYLVWGIVVTITGLWVGLGGLILNFGINDFLIGFAKTFGDTGIGLAVDTTWGTVRDFVNLTFIFGLVYIGFKMILDSNDSNTKRSLALLIMAALLINFSLFITKSIIEVSNQFAVKIIENGFEVEYDTGGYSVDTSGSLMQRLGLTGIMGSNIEALSAVGEERAWGFIFGTGILFIIAGFVFAAGGILLIIRFAILNFYMVLSPVLFLGFILPPLSGTINKYWEKFLSKCFFAPIYILMLYFSFRILDGMASTGRFKPNSTAYQETLGFTNGGSMSDAAQSTIPFFILTCFFLIGSLVIAEKLGAEGAGKAVGMMKDAKNSAQKRVENSAKWTGKQAAVMATAIPRQQARKATALLGNDLKYKIKKLQDRPEGSLVGKIARSNFVHDYGMGTAIAMEHVKYGTGRDQETSDYLHNETVRESNRRITMQAGQDALNQIREQKEMGKFVDDEGNVITGATEEELDAKRAERTEELNGRVEKAEQIAKDITYAEFSKMAHKHRVLAGAFVKPEVLDAHLKDTNFDKTERLEVKAQARENIMARIFQPAGRDENGNMLKDKDGNLMGTIINDEAKRLTPKQLDMLDPAFLRQYMDVWSADQMKDMKQQGIFSDTASRENEESRKKLYRDNMKQIREEVVTIDGNEIKLIDLLEGVEENGKMTYPLLQKAFDQGEDLRALMPLLKVKQKRDEKTGQWKITVKAEEMKKVADQTHPDLFKQKGWERIGDPNWLAAFMKSDTGFKGMDYNDRMDFVKSVNNAAKGDHLANGYKESEKYTDTQIKRAKALKEVLDDPRTRKNFLGREDGAYEAKDAKKAKANQADTGNSPSNAPQPTGNYELRPGETVSGGIIVPPNVGNGPRES